MSSPSIGSSVLAPGPILCKTMESADPPGTDKTTTQDGKRDRDEKVKIDLPFETALRALLETPPEPEKATTDEKRES